MVEVLIPNTQVSKIEKPLVFLAGPSTGAPEWRKTAVQLFDSSPIKSSIIIASPEQNTKPTENTRIINSSEENFPRQRAWENHYLTTAAQNGVILFWLPGEVQHKCEKAYGAMTRMELGQLMIEHKGIIVNFGCSKLYF